MSVKDFIGREIHPGDYVGQRNINDQSKGASPVNAGRIGKVVSAAGRTRVEVKFLTDDGTRMISGEYLMLVRYIDGQWTSVFDPATELTDAERKAMDEADRRGTFGVAINAAAQPATPATPAKKPRNLRETVARTLARQNVEAGGTELSIPFEDYWDAVLTHRVREDYRRRADELVTLIRGGAR